MHFGLIGRSLGHSFSKAYFQEKFKHLALPYSYSNCELRSIEDFPQLLKQKEWAGFNVTIPFKEEILPFIHELSPEVLSIGAANVITVHNQKLWAHNTDHIGFRKDLVDFLKNEKPEKALVLGSGGASKAIIYALAQMQIETQLVGRVESLDKWDYQKASQHLQEFPLVINCSPLGTFPNIEEKPALLFPNHLKGHFFYDLIYNPVETQFLKEARVKGAKTRNGQQMLVYQAEASWAIWTKP